jgi:hypothetical protein
MVDRLEGLTLGTDGLGGFRSRFGLTRIGEMLLEGIDQDKQSREEWISTRAEGIDLLGLRIDKPRTGPGGGTTGTPLQGMAIAKDNTLLDAVVRGQANAIGEFLPASGPAKIEDVGGSNNAERCGTTPSSAAYDCINAEIIQAKR